MTSPIYGMQVPRCMRKIEYLAALVEDNVPHHGNLR